MPLKNPPLPWTPWLAALTLAASLAGCGGSDSGPPDPLQPYRQQSLQWAPCDPTILNSTEEQSRKVWQQLGERLQCSTMRAPMDWARPERSDVFVGAMRLAAADPAQRRGSLLFNPWAAYSWTPYSTCSIESLLGMVRSATTPSCSQRGQRNGVSSSHVT